MSEGNTSLDFFVKRKGESVKVKPPLNELSDEQKNDYIEFLEHLYDTCQSKLTRQQLEIEYKSGLISVLEDKLVECCVNGKKNK